MQDILQFILKNIVTVPDDVKIEVQDEEGTSNYIVTVNPVDVGRIIGKEGKVIKAIRTIMRTVAIQRGVHIRISVVSENELPPAEASTPEPLTQPTTQDDGSITVEV
jgi:hypothetical protein